MPRRVRFILFFGVVAMLVLATGISAGAAPEDEIEAVEEEIAGAQERLMEMRSEAGAASEEDLAEAQASLEERASQVYKSGNVAFIDVLVGVDDFSQFAARLELWMRLLEQERATYDAVLEAKNDLEEHKSALETERARRAESVEEAMAHKEHAAEAEAEAEDYLDSLNAGLQGAIEADQEREARLAHQAAAEAVAERQAELAAERAALQEQRAQDRAAEQAAADQAAADQAAADQAAADQAAAEQAAREEAAAQAAAEEAERQAELAAERAALQEQR